MRDQDDVGDRLGQVVVRPAVEAVGLVALAVAGRDHQHGDPVLLGAQGAHDVVPGEPRQHHVEQDRVEVAVARELEPGGAVAGDLDGEPVGGEPAAQGVCHPRLVLHDQQLHAPNVARVAECAHRFSAFSQRLLVQAGRMSLFDRHPQARWVVTFVAVLLLTAGVSGVGALQASRSRQARPAYGLPAAGRRATGPAQGPVRHHRADRRPRPAGPPRRRRHRQLGPDLAGLRLAHPPPLVRRPGPGPALPARSARRVRRDPQRRQPLDLVEQGQDGHATAASRPPRRAARRASSRPRRSARSRRRTRR